MLQRMTGMEVYKGPSTVRFGPQTISGAINFLSRPIPEELNAGGSVSLGRFLTGVEHGYVGTSNEWGGILFEAVNAHSDGFKELDTGGPTGFSRSEFNLRGALQFESDDARLVHDVDLGTMYSREISRETYLGLSEEDFRDDPYRRYLASDRGRMQWWRTGAHARYRLKVEDEWRLSVALYRHDLERSWFKFNTFADRTDAFAVLNNPNSGGNDTYYDVLTGQTDSAGFNDLLIGENHRRFVSQGIQTLTSHHYQSEAITNRAELGIRVHHDWIERDHTEDRFLVRSGELERAETETQQTTDNRGETLALAFHVHDRFQWKDLQIAGGVRVEHIMMDFDIRPNDLGVTEPDSVETTQTAVLPGIGVDYEFVDGFHGIVGVHRGFSAVAPGQDDAIDPEYSVNYEFGGRYEREATGTKIEAVGFYNDYSNILDICGFTCGGGLNQQTQFNGGNANVFGVEFEATHTILANKGYDIPLRASYTYTHATFASSFDSTNPRWGDVEDGDRIPYVPRHEVSLELGVSHERWSANTRLAFHDAVLEEAGTYDEDGVLKTDSYAMLDALVAVRLVHNLEAFVRGENLLNQQAIAARRPLGARPVKPLMVMGGFRWKLHEPGE
jgi:Fe(3+) dicitrate transport protein